MTVVKKSVVIDRPIEEVFRYITDLEKLPKWATGIRGARLVSGEPRQRGARYEVGGHILGRKQRGHYTVVVSEEDRLFEAEGSLGPLDLHDRFTFDRTGTGVTVSQVSRVEARGAMRVAQPLFGPLFSRIVEKDLRRLKKLLESMPPGVSAREGTVAPSSQEPSGAMSPPEE
jgi:uncharacterized membrane protein